METREQSWMAFYARLTWAMGTLGFSALILEVFQPVYRVALKGLPATPVLQVVAALASAMAVGAYFIQRKLRQNPKAMRHSLKRLAICWGLIDGVFMYGLMAQIASESFWVAFPFFTVAALLAIRTFPDHKLIKLSLDEPHESRESLRAA